MTNDYSLSDIRAVTNSNGNDGFLGGGNGWWIILMFVLFACGWGGFGGNNWGGGNGGAPAGYTLSSDFATSQRQMYDGFNSAERGLDTIRNGLCDGFYTQAQLVNGINTNIMQSNNAVQSQLAQCCCDVREAISGVNYNMAMNNNAISKQLSDCCCENEKIAMQNRFDNAQLNCNTLQAIDRMGDRIIDYLNCEKTQRLRDENQALRLTASQVAQNQYLISQLRPTTTA